MLSKLRLIAISAASVVALVACGKKEPPAPQPAPAPAPMPAAPAPAPVPAGVTVSSVSLGKGVGADKKVTTASDTFAKGDTIYASVATVGSGSATLAAKWTYTKDGKTVPVKEDTATISATGPASTEFHISKPDGWPVGTYQLDVTVDGKPATTTSFKVE
jgi:hypothetical protein